MKLNLVNKRNQTFLYKAAFSLIALLLFGYILVRGIKLSFTHDESLSYTILTGSDKWVLTANNHWLNTILTYLLSRFFGYSELVLRLPNILAFGIYLFYFFKFLRRFSKYWVTALLFLPIVLLNPFVLDFFSLSRGYGLAMAFLVASLYYIIKALREENYKNLILFTLFSLLSIYANYSFLMVVLAVLIGYFLCQLSKRIDLNAGRIEPDNQENLPLENTALADKSSGYRYSLNFRIPSGNWVGTFKKLLPPKELLFYGLLGVTIVPAIYNTLELSKRNELYFGGEEGIIKDTLYSIITCSFYGAPYTQYIGLVLSLLGVLVISGFLIRKSKELWFCLILITSLLLIPGILNAFIGMKYPIERSALYWVVVLGIFILFLSESVLSKSSLALKAPVILLVTFLSVGSVLNFIKSFNLKYTYTWAYDANTRDAVKSFAENINKSQKNKVGINWLFEPAINYYREIYNYTWLEPVQREDIKSGYEYYYIQGNDLEVLKQDCLLELKHYPDTESWLMKKCESDNK